MLKMFAQLFTMLKVLFEAGENTAQALNELSKWGHENAAALADEGREQRKQKMLAHMAATRKAEADNA